MSKLAWERVAGSAAKLATVSVIAALAATSNVSANGVATEDNATAKVPANYGQSVQQPSWGQPIPGQAAWGHPAPGQAAFAPQQQPAWGHQSAAWGQQQMIAPANTATFAPAGAPAPQMPVQQQHKAAQGMLNAPMPAHRQFGQRMPIFANTQANGITYGPPSYTPPPGFDPKLASSSPFPSNWQNPAMGHQRPPAWAQQHPQQGHAPMPNPAGAPVYGGYGQQIEPASIGQYAPAEPTYAPAEPLRPNYAAAPAPTAPATYESVDVTPAAQPATTVQAASSYSYEMAPATSAPAYVGQSTDLSATTYAPATQTYAPATETAANPYEVVIGQQGGASAYEAAPAYQAAPAHETATSAYEMTTEVPAYQQGTTYGGSSYETVTAAPSYEAAPAYQAALPAQDYSTSSSFASGNGHFVQVGAFRNPQRAERLVRKLQGAGEQPIVTQATVRGKLYHRVRVPAMDKRDAKSVQSRIRGLGYYEARMVRG